MASELRPLVNEVGGASPLNLTIYEGVRTLRQSWREDAVNAMVLYTDGIDTASKLNGERLDETRLNQELGDDTERPVRVLIVAFDAGRCASLLSRVTAFDLDCFQVDERSDLQKVFRGVDSRLRELAG